MRNIKKTIACLLAAASVLSIAPLGAINAFAGEKKTLFLEEEFNKNAFSSQNWYIQQAEGSQSVQLSCDEESGYLSAFSPDGVGYNVENYVFGTAEKITNLKSLQLDFCYNKNKWNAIFFSGTNEFPVKEDGSGTFANTSSFNSYQAQIMLANPAGGVGSISANNEQTETTFESKNFDFELDNWYTLKLVPTSATEANLYCYAQGAEAGEPLTVLTVHPSEADNYDFVNGFYFFMGSEGGGQMNIDNLKIVTTENGQEITRLEKFNDSELESFVTDYATNPAIKHTMILPNFALSLEQSKVGDSLLYTTMIPKEESPLTSLECVSATFNVSMRAAKNEDAIAFVFGVPDGGKIENGCYALMIEKSKKGDNYISIVKYSEDGYESLSGAPIELRKLGSSAGASLRLVLNKDGTVSVYDESVVDKEESLVLETTIGAADYYVGYLGFAAVKDNTGKTTIDNLTVVTTNYKIPVTKSVTHNFSNDYFGNKETGNLDFVCHGNPENSLFVQDGRLVWDGTSDETFFGSAHEYDDFVLDFKICNIYTTGEEGDRNSTKPGCWIGFDIGKKNVDAAGYGSNIMYAFQITPDANQQEAGVTFWPYTSGASMTDKTKLVTLKETRIPAYLFEDIQYSNPYDKASILEKDAVCVRLVADKGSLKLYMKKACEAEFTLYYEVDGVDTTGYTALCCTGFTYMEIDDFSMANISDLYICADNVEPPKEVIKEVDKIIYDNNNVTDYNGLDETKLNQGCGSSLSATYCILPLVTLAAFVIGKQRKDGGNK